MTIGFAMECFEKGLIPESDACGLDLSFWSGRAIIELVHKISKREGIGNLLAEGSKRMSVKIEGSCVIACLFGAFAITPQDYAEAISALTGWTVTEDELKTVAKRAWNLSRLFNAREGFTRLDDTLPEKLFTQGSTKGPSKGEVVDRPSFENRMTSEASLISGTYQKLKKL